MAGLYQNKWPGEKLADPWAKGNQWRYDHPFVSHKYNRLRLFPGFWYGTGAFAVYCAGEYAYNSMFASSKEHDHHH